MPLPRRLFLGLAGAAMAMPASAAAAAPDCGAALPLSGSAALIGDEVLRGILLAVDAVNAAGGVAGAPVKLDQADMPDQASATQAVNKLMSGSHAGLVFGSGVSALSFPASAAAELAQVPFIELSAPADGICNRGFKYLLRTGPGSGMIGQAAAQAVQARFAGRTLGILYNNGASGAAIGAAVRDALAGSKAPVALEIGYPEGDEDLSAEVGRLMRAKVDVLIHAAGLDDALGLAQAAQAQGWKPGALIGCGEGYGFRETAQALGDGFSGTFVVAAPFYPPGADAVRDAYMARFGAMPRAADSLTAYAGAKLVLETLNHVGGDAGKLLAALRQHNQPKGSLANGFGAAFDQHGQNTGAFVTLQQWHNTLLLPA